MLLGTISCKADTADESQNTDNEKIIKDFKATDFIGEMTSEGIYVLDSRLSWTAFEGAEYYDIFIDNKKTNDEKVTDTKFRTAFNGTVDIDEKMEIEPKEITITIKAMSKDILEIANAEIKKTIPARPVISNLKINGKVFENNIVVENPLVITLKVNNGIKFVSTDKEKAIANLKNYIKIQRNSDDIPYCNYDYNGNTGIITLSLAGAIKQKSYEQSGFALLIGSQFSDNNRFWYTKEDISFKFKLAAAASTMPLEVEKIIINKDESLDLMKGKPENINVNSSVSIMFNQLIDISTYEESQPGDIGRKGVGIYITTASKTGKKGSDNSRLINPLFEQINSNGIYKTKASFDMVGQSFFIQTLNRPLEGETDYYIVIDDTIISGVNTKLAAEIRKPFKTGTAAKIFHSLNVFGGKIEGQTKTEIKIAEGESFTIIADVPAGKTFKEWYASEDFVLTSEQKKQSRLTLTMEKSDVSFTATYND